MNTKSPSRQERSFGPLRDKTLRSIIRRKFITEYGFSDAVPVAEFITDDLMALIDRVCPPFERVKPGQMVWLDVPKDLPRNQIGQRLRELPLKPILLTVLTEEDVEDHIDARSREEYRILRRRRVARIFKEADTQEATLPYADPAAFYGLSESMVQRDVHHWQDEQEEVLPHRGRVHDMGPSTSHKEPIIERILQGHQIPDVAREFDHSIADVERYYADYNAVEVACGITDDLTKIATLTRLKLSVVKQYYRLVEKFQPHKMLKNQSSGSESSDPDAPQVE
jgi:hypothetical protein